MNTQNYELKPNLNPRKNITLILKIIKQIKSNINIKTIKRAKIRNLNP